MCSYNILFSTAAYKLCFFFPEDDSDDDLNDEDIPGFGGPGTPLLATPDKGKGRAPQNLASPGLPPPAVSGNIGTSGNAPRSSTRQSFGGVNVETRYAFSRPPYCGFSFSHKNPTSYAGVDTLDEPITATIVRQLR